MAERAAHNRPVGGSSPPGPTMGKGMDLNEIKILIELQRREEDLKLLKNRINRLEAEKKILKGKKKGSWKS